MYSVQVLPVVKDFAQFFFSISSDDEGPIFLSNPGNISIPTDPGEPFGTATWDIPAVLDNGGNVNVTSTHQPGDTFDIGSTTVVYTANDTAGNIATIKFVVFVSGGS